MMQRLLDELERATFDVLVIGSGIYGAFVAWDAALRGLSVALVDQGDFGNATSANSLKIIHGGLRYLKDVNIGLIRRMAREREVWLRIAPHLVQPLPCLLPTEAGLVNGRLALGAALAANDLITFSRDRLTDTQRQLPRGRLLSQVECLQALPGLANRTVTGAAAWYDAQLYSSERMLLALVISAARAGAVAANYVRVTAFRQVRQGVKGVCARDVLTGRELEIRARVTVNCAGAWTDVVLGLLDGHALPAQVRLSVAVNLVTRQILPGAAFGLRMPGRSDNAASKPERQARFLMVTPWRQYSLIGTAHRKYSGPPEVPPVDIALVEEMIAAVNAAYPAAALTRGDVCHVHRGFLPALNASPQTAEVRLVREGRVVDHARHDGVTGLITVVGVKYTAARALAQQAVDLAVTKLQRSTTACATHTTPIYGGQIDGLQDFLKAVQAQRPSSLEPESADHLAHVYGTQYAEVAQLAQDRPVWGQRLTAGSPATKAQVVHAVRHEMTQKLADVVLRRTEVGAAGLPDEACLLACAELMAAELGWDELRCAQEIAELRASYVWPITRTQSPQSTPWRN